MKHIPRVFAKEAMMNIISSAKKKKMKNKDTSREFEALLRF
jgi:hypothetical protein